MKALAAGSIGAATALSLALLTVAPEARANRWSGAAAGGLYQWFHPEFSGHGFVMFDLRGTGVVGRGDFHLNFNTETLQVGVERVPVGTPHLEFSAALRAEGALAGILRFYYQDGLRVGDRGFFASYVQGFTSLKWLPGGPSSVELVLGARQWFFGRDRGQTNTELSLPPDTFAFEPRLRYTFWRITSPGEEWDAHVVFPRLEGIAFGVELGADVRSDSRAWGTIGTHFDDRRNRPGSAIWMGRQWLRAGHRLGRAVRVQIEQNASYGVGEDDLTRNRVGGMTPFAVPVPGIAWPAVLSERLVAAQASLHLRPSQRYRHEFGVAVAGGAFNDPRRVGALDTYGGLGGAALFADLRIWRLQGYVRLGWAFPLGGLAQPPHLAAYVGLGARLF